jgi:uncharacterized protein YkwD
VEATDETAALTHSLGSPSCNTFSASLHSGSQTSWNIQETDLDPATHCATRSFQVEVTNGSTTCTAASCSVGDTATLTEVDTNARRTASASVTVNSAGGSLLQQCVTQSEIAAAIVDEPGLKAELFRLINEYRQQNGRSALQRVQILETVAQRHSIFMEQFGNLSHDLGFGNEVTRIRGEGYDSTACVGETIGTASSPQAILDAWKASSAHNTVLLTRELTQVGIGLESGCGSSGSFSLWWTADFGCSAIAYGAAQPTPTVDKQSLANQLIGYLQAADAAYCAGNEDAVIQNFVSFVNLWAEPPDRGGPWLRSNCVLTQRVANCLRDVLAGLSFPTTSFDGTGYMIELWGVGFF